MIKGVHAMFYTSEPEAFRAFVRDKLQHPYRDVGGGWLIFETQEAEVACHPEVPGEKSQTSGTHDISFYCDDIEQTVEELRGRGVTFEDDIGGQRYGRVIHFVMPGGVRVELYEPSYTKDAES